MKRALIVALASLFCLSLAAAQMTGEKVDTAAISKIKDEGYNRSNVMNILSHLTDVSGPRLTWSPEYKEAADWASAKLKEWGLVNIGYDEWDPQGKGWTLNKFSANMVEPTTGPLIAYPKAWSPGTKGTVRGKVVRLKVEKAEDLAAYKGKLKNAFVFMSDSRDISAHFTAEGYRLADSTLLAMANAGETGGQMRRMMGDSASRQRFIDRTNFFADVLEFLMKEKAAALVDAGRGDGGTIFVQSATVPRRVKSINEMFSGAAGAFSEAAPEILPQVTMAAEHYNRILRTLDAGKSVELEMNIDVSWTKPVKGFNVIGEIPGTDLKDEIVMIGAHFDSWHGGTGATDNATGSAVCMEAIRILQATGLKPRRTIRIGLWGGEEQGLYGSREYVKEYLAAPKSDDMMGMMMGAQNRELDRKPAYDKFAAYFNNDNGTGKVRGVYLQGNDAVRPIFRQWLQAAGDKTAQTLTIENTSGTDHLAFDAVGLPGFQFIQDPVEYNTRTHHSNMDVYDRVQADDVKQGSVFMAIFAYNAAMRDQKLPRKPMPAPQTVGSN
ncbi:MAG: hypothetical protein A2X67_10110 [Ignavibacteria bacterium GWA2_55_11]|nr:MAG: hypothetical protein A2X67_10110 [Ignavibacteria bacterium GWA2_55_11]OGU63241.1 MAG: hypothetical protein A3C56_10280 [Ignavibacteria bacterium RIFCSPHIGHO2_02_FULL_56_12]OGU70956.1 MAG: hypothetical protein A3H45_12445 [Ignavibacteria bacterium RIFCSPLOWO2_02_FULL_55_14]OGU76564.1 MAG: hypothetical protein A3G43_04575 [Ignavibacteria bacterium RIFCSPLOWO2_12_FULL_56_21]